MTTPIVPSITDEELAEITAFTDDNYAADFEEVLGLKAGKLRRLVARLCAAEKDAARYRWIREQHNDAMGCTWVSVYHPGGWVSLDTSVSGKKVASLDLDSAVDTAMEQSK